MHYKIKKNSSFDELLQSLFPAVSKRSLIQKIKYGLVQINGKTVNTSKLPVFENQIVSIFPKPKKISPLKVFFEDRHLIVIEKPMGLLSVPLDKKGSTNAYSLLKKDLPELYPVHRIDRETSGILLFAKTKACQARLKDIFHDHDIQRRYYALLEGTLSEKSGTWEDYLIEEKKKYQVYVTNQQKGQLAITHFEVIKQFRKLCFVSFYLETGKKHQIRVQAASRGYPIAGDFRYSAKTNPLKRLALHAAELKFCHPFTKKEMKFYSVIPVSFQQFGAYDQAHKQAF